MMGQGHSIPIHNLDMRSNTISHSYAGRSIEGETSLAQFVCLSVSLPLLALSTHPLQKLLCGGEERRRPNCVFRFTLVRRCSAAGGGGGRGRQKRREIKTKWNVLLSPGYPFYSLPQRQSSAPHVQSPRRSDGSGILFTTIAKVSLTAP